MINTKSKQLNVDRKSKIKVLGKGQVLKDNPVKLKINVVSKEKQEKVVPIMNNKKDLSPNNRTKNQKPLGLTPKNENLKRSSDFSEKKIKANLKTDIKDLNKKVKIPFDSGKKGENKSINIQLEHKFKEKESSPIQKVPSSINSFNNYLTTNCTELTKEINTIKTNSIESGYISGNENLKTIVVNLNTITNDIHQNKVYCFNYLNDKNHIVIQEDNINECDYSEEMEKNIEKINEIFKLMGISKNEEEIIKNLSENNKLSFNKLRKKTIEDQETCLNGNDELLVKKKGFDEEISIREKQNQITEEIYLKSDQRIKKYNVLLSFMRRNLEIIKEIINETEDHYAINSVNILRDDLKKKSSSSHEIHNLKINNQDQEKSKYFSSLSFLKLSPNEKLKSDSSLSKLNFHISNSSSKSDNYDCDIDEFLSNPIEKIDFNIEFSMIEEKSRSFLKFSSLSNFSPNFKGKNTSSISFVKDFLGFFNEDPGLSIKIETESIEDNDVTKKLEDFVDDNKKFQRFFEPTMKIPRNIEFNNKFHQGEMKNIVIKSETPQKQTNMNLEEKQESKCILF